MREIDQALLPSRPLLDSSVLFGALAARDTGPDAQACRKLLDAIMEAGKTILIAAPSIAELLRGSTPVEPPKTMGIIVVGFDDQAARLLAEDFPQEILIKARDATGTPLQYIKYDAMIVACAKRHRADCLVTRDAVMVRLAEQAKVRAYPPQHFYSRQGQLPGVAVPKAAAKPKLVKDG
jgi:predicted nucleic acid-binding protein